MKTQLTRERIARLGDVLQFCNDIVHPSDNPSGEATFVGLEHIERDTGVRIGSEKLRLTEMTGRRARFRQGNIVYGYLRPYLNKVWIAEFDGLCSVDQYVFDVRPTADLRYVVHYLRSSVFLRAAPIDGAPGQLPRIRSGEIADTPIPLPSLTEQRRIAAILDAADGLCQKRRHSLRLLDQLSQAIFIEMFGDPALNPHGWPMLPLGKMSEKFSDGPFGSNLKSEHYVASGIRVVRLQNIGLGYFDDTDKAYISESHFENLHKHECIPGDILIGTLGDPNLRACIQPKSIEVALNKADCVQMRCDQRVSVPEYVAALLNCPSTERMAQSEIQGQTRLRISMGRLRGLELPLPPKEMQEVFAERVRSVTALKAEAEGAARLQDDLFSSLQHRAFSGER